MSRTYRKNSLTEEKSLVQHVNEQLAWQKAHNHYYKYVLTDHGKKAYDTAMEEWIELYGTGPYYPEPLPYHFKKAYVVPKNTDFEQLEKEEIEYYKKLSRDDACYETSRNKAFKKHCPKNLRCINRALVTKIIKDDSIWENKPYPDTYLGKKYIWDYW
jgi:hypothetical protein